jgi:hypothetical protein
MSIIGFFNPILPSRVIADFIDFIHDLLCPLNARGNQLVCPWASLGSAEQVIGSFHVHARKNCSHDPDHAFAPFIHGEAWYQIRLLFVSKCFHK